MPKLIAAGLATPGAPRRRSGPGALLERHRELAVLEEVVRDAAVGRAVLPVRSDCQCNPGVREVALSLSTQELAGISDRGTRRGRVPRGEG